MLCRSPAFEASCKYTKLDDMLGMGLMIANLLGPVPLRTSQDLVNALVSVIDTKSRCPALLKSRISAALEGEFKDSEYYKVHYS